MLCVPYALSIPCALTVTLHEPALVALPTILLGIPTNS